VTIVDLLLNGDVESHAYYRAVDGVDVAGIAAVLGLVAHPEPDVRRAVALTLPLLTGGDDPSMEMVAAALALSVDPDARVRDYACMALGTQWRTVDTPELREALVARLDDLDGEVRCEALVGLAYRHDPEALPRVRAALSRPSGDVWLLEMVAAGTTSDPQLHDLVLRHQEGWHDRKASRIADAALRLTDPEGPGRDVVASVAELYRRRAHGLPDGDALWGWEVMDTMLDIAPDRARGFLWAVLAGLDSDPDAHEEVSQRSELAALAGTDVD
jgi:HEAT repeat protein